MNRNASITIIACVTVVCMTTLCGIYLKMPTKEAPTMFTLNVDAGVLAPSYSISIPVNELTPELKKQHTEMAAKIAASAK